MGQGGGGKGASLLSHSESSQPFQASGACGVRHFLPLILISITKRLPAAVRVLFLSKTSKENMVALACSSGFSFFFFKPLELGYGMLCSACV